jgi:ribose-phosphate pyrophosphokinase
MLTDVDLRIIKELIDKSRLRPMKIFGLGNTQQYAQKVAARLNMPLTPHEEKIFDDGENLLRSSDAPEGNVRGHTVFVIHSLYSDDEESVADKFMNLCIMCGGLKTASAHDIVAIIPYLGWTRQDRKTASRAPISTKIVVNMLEAAGVTRVVLMDVHNLSAEQNAFNIPMDHLEAKNLHAAWCADRLKTAKRIAVLSPDKGGFARATHFRNALARLMHREQAEIGVAIYDKLRDLITGELSGGNIIGDIRDADVVVVDDLISTAGTITRAGVAVPEFGGRLAAICVTHGLFTSNANDHLDRISSPIVIADTVEPFRLNPSNRAKVRVVDTSEMVANAMRRIHSETGSISELLS